MKNISLNIFTVLIPACFLFPLLKENRTNLLIIMLALNLIVYKIVAKDYSFIKVKTILLTIPFWIVLLFSFFSTNFSESLIHIKHSLLFLAIPVIFSLIPLDLFSKGKLDFYITVLKTVCLLIAIIYILSYLKNFGLSDFSKISYNNSTFRNYIYNEFKLFVIHPTYYTSILVLCLAHSLYLFLNQKKYYELIYIIIFYSITFLLLTKLNTVIMIVLTVFMLLFKNPLKLKNKLILTFFSISLLLLFAYFTPGIKSRFEEVIQSFNVKPKDLSFDSTNIRKAIFDCDITLIKHNWVQGVGFENIQLRLNECYSSNYDSNFYKLVTYMTHNYYFYILISSGIIGFLFYLFYLFNIINICLKSNIFLFKTFVFNALTICFVEDYFYRQHGGLYFNLILMCFINLIEYKKQQIQN